MSDIVTVEIRIRAERRCGEMLKEREMNKGAAQPTWPTDTTTLQELGISKQQSSRQHPWYREGQHCEL